MSSILFLSLLSCQRQCEGIGCNINPIESNLLVFISPRTALSDRTPDFAALTIKGSSAHAYDWGFAVDDSNNLWMGTHNGALYQLPYQIGTKALSEEEPLAQISSQGLGRRLLYLGEDYLLVASPLSDASEDARDSGHIDIFYGYNFETSALRINNDTYLSRFPSQLWQCGDLDGDGRADWIASAKDKLILGLSGVWLRPSANELSLSDFPIIEADSNTDGFAQKIDCSHDFDQNGEIDLVISSPFSPSETGSGKIALYLNGWDNSPFLWLPEEGQEWYGYSFAIGDINGDQVLDWSIFSFVNDIPRLEISSMNDQFGLELQTILEADQNQTSFGKRQTIADIDGDGFDDLVVGAPFYNASGETTIYPESGRIFFFYGQEELRNITQRIDTFSGNKSYHRLGERFWLHDFNQDGRLDLIAPVLFP